MNPEEKPIQYYRYEDVGESYGTEEDGYYTDLHIRLREYQVVKTTPCGVWIQEFMDRRHFVRSDTRKRFAWPTKVEAKESFLRRKQKQLRILQAHVAEVLRAIELGKDL